MYTYIELIIYVEECEVRHRHNRGICGQLQHSTMRQTPTTVGSPQRSLLPTALTEDPSLDHQDGRTLLGEGGGGGGHVPCVNIPPGPDVWI